MKTILLLICMGSLYNQIQCQDFQESDWSGKNLTKIPKSTSTNITKLNLSQNNIILDAEDQKTLMRYENLTGLDLSQNNILELTDSYFKGLSKIEVLILRNNHITSIGVMSLVGLENLRILDLSINRITYLPVNIHIPSLQLQTFYLQDNNLSTLDIKEALKDLKTPLHITLSGNPWNCDCSLIGLSIWLNNNTVILENDNTTMCATPKNMINYTITVMNTAPADVLSCVGSSDIPSTTPSISISDNSTAPLNGTNTTSSKGNSWTFLVGVIVVGLVTSLLILVAVKFPRWYDFILSYNHHRLKEEEPYMFEEEFNVDFDMGTNDKSRDDDTVVVFEQTHSFVPEEDGFIEDKYIDENDITELN
ncbi:leucine-rich repeat-containing protein 19 [Dendropsophus ebraccatus]|uniref:leucine-rich repeat-containing protein 19 n=1 Tax=Dendropsophus ebraccatus TaxID=150705 RepID=UPI0038310AC3